MPTNFYFQNYTDAAEQMLYDDLLVENIQIHGIDCFYLPRTLTNYDSVLTEDAQSSFTSSYMVEVFLKNYMSFGGDRNLMSKFAGLEIRDQIVFCMARTAFSRYVGLPTGYTRPRESDVLYFPLNKKCFVIRYVEAYEFMYPLGMLPSWELTLELFEYSNETFATGNPDIDVLQQKFSTNSLDYALRTESGNWLTTEGGAIITNERFVIPKIDPIAQNETFDDKTVDLDLIDWTEEDPFSEGRVGNRESEFYKKY